MTRARKEKVRWKRTIGSRRKPAGGVAILHHEFPLVPGRWRERSERFIEQRALDGAEFFAALRMTRVWEFRMTKWGSG